MASDALVCTLSRSRRGVGAPGTRPGGECETGGQPDQNAEEDERPPTSTRICSRPECRRSYTAMGHHGAHGTCYASARKGGYLTYWVVLVRLFGKQQRLRCAAATEGYLGATSKRRRSLRREAPRNTTTNGGLSGARHVTRPPHGKHEQSDAAADGPGTSRRLALPGTSAGGGKDATSSEPTKRPPVLLLALEGTRDDGHVLTAESSIDELIPLPSKAGENGKTLGICLFESQVDVFESQGQREFGRIVVVPECARSCQRSRAT